MVRIVTCPEIDKMMVVVMVTVLIMIHLQPNIEMNWNLLKFLPEVASCQTNFNVCSMLCNIPMLFH